jgi:hypothetical protein
LGISTAYIGVTDKIANKNSNDGISFFILIIMTFLNLLKV